MYLVPDTVPHYLIDRQLLTAESLIAGDLMVVDRSSRNVNYEVVRRRAPGFFIKQVRQSTPDLLDSFVREADFYGRVMRDDALAALRPLLPQLRSYDARHHVLVLERLGDAESLWRHHRRLGAFPLDLAARQADVLAAYHDGVSVADPSRPAFENLPRRVPWILSVHESSPAAINQYSGGNAGVIEILRRYPAFPRALKAIKRSWRTNAVIHGDIKWENLMVVPGSDGESTLRVIDWEMVDLGDDGWDVGAILQSYLTCWIYALPLGDGRDLARAAADAPYDEEAMKQAMHAFWHRYATRRRLSSKRFRRMRERALACAAARMIQTAFESVQRSTHVTAHALCALQMAMNILHDPATAVRDFMLDAAPASAGAAP